MIWVIVIISIVVLTACSSNDKAGEGLQQDRNASIVELIEVQNQSIDYTYNLSGTLQPLEKATVIAQTSGEVKQVIAETGDAVQVGDILAVLDYEQIQLQLNQAKSGVAQAEGQVEAAKAAIEAAEAGRIVAEAQVQAAEANLESVKKGATAQQRKQAENAVAQTEAAYNKVKADADRYEQLYKQGAISLSDYENIKLQLENAEKTYDNAKQALSAIEEGATAEQLKATEATLQQAKAGKQSALASISQAKAALNQAEAGYNNAIAVQEQTELALSKATITAPIEGIVLEKWVTASQIIGVGSPAYTIGFVEQLKVVLPIPDSQAYSWKVGQQVELQLNGNTRIGILQRIHPQTNMGTGTISAEVILDNPNHDWIPGQVINARRVNGDNQGILVPVEAVISFGDKPYVFCYVDGVAQKTTVELGDKLLGNQFHVIQGLKEGDKIVTSGADKLFDGDSIQIVEEPGI